MRYAERRDIFGSFDSSDDPSPRWIRLLDSDWRGNLVQFNDDDNVMRHDRDDRTGHDVGTSINITQETRYCGILRVAPEKKAWMPPHRVLDSLSDTISNRYRIRLSDLSRLNGLAYSANDFRTKHDFYIVVFFKHRWYSGTTNVMGPRWSRYGVRSFTILNRLDAMTCLTRWPYRGIGLRSGILPVLVTNSINYQERPGYHASPAVIRANVV